VKFVDEVIITVQSGCGGKGSVSFRRERFIPKGGPDGGDGGRGGNVVLKAGSRNQTLSRFQHKKHFKAPDGQNGRGKLQAGKDGKDLIIEIPTGTAVRNLETAMLIKDFISPGETFIVAKGGRGGLGNKHFASSTNRAPRFAQSGEPGQHVVLHLELKLLADAGIIGLPNAGKSTLLSILSSATPKIGNYPFTTLSPNLGVVQPPDKASFIIADIPGLIEGAHKGVGLGIRFLRHIERTRLLVHLIDASTIDLQDPLRDYHILRKELSAYRQELLEKPVVVAVNKLDLPGAEKAAETFLSHAENMDVLFISARTGEGVDRLRSKIVELLDRWHAERQKNIF